MHWKNTISTISTNITGSDPYATINDGSKILCWFTLISCTINCFRILLCIYYYEIHWQFVWAYYENAHYTKVYMQRKSSCRGSGGGGCVHITTGYFVRWHITMEAKSMELGVKAIWLWTFVLQFIRHVIWTMYSNSLNFNFFMKSEISSNYLLVSWQLDSFT